jgi:hypothetical protein
LFCSSWWKSRFRHSFATRLNIQDLMIEEGVKANAVKIPRG